MSLQKDTWCRSRGPRLFSGVVRSHGAPEAQGIEWVAMRRDQHHRGHDHLHGHTHGAVDPSVATSERGIWAVKWSFVGLFATAALRIVVVVLSGSVALLSDTIRNFGDAATAIPLWIAFALSRLGTSRRFPFGYGRVEDLAGVI